MNSVTAPVRDRPEFYHACMNFSVADRKVCRSAGTLFGWQAFLQIMPCITLYMKHVLCGSTFNLTPVHGLKYLLTRMIVSCELGTLAIELNLPLILIPYTSTVGEVRLICMNAFRIHGINYKRHFNEKDDANFRIREIKHFSTRLRQ